MHLLQLENGYFAKMAGNHPQPRALHTGGVLDNLGCPPGTRVHRKRSTDPDPWKMTTAAAAAVRGCRSSPTMAS